METVLYDVTFASNRKGNFLHIKSCEHFIACVNGVDDNDTFRAYHLHNGKHIVPDYDAIRSALPHNHRKAFDRAGSFWFPLTLHSALASAKDSKNAASLTLNDRRGQLLGTIYATPYLFTLRTQPA